MRTCSRILKCKLFILRYRGDFDWYVRVERSYKSFVDWNVIFVCGVKQSLFRLLA